MRFLFFIGQQYKKNGSPARALRFLYRASPLRSLRSRILAEICFLKKIFAILK